MNTYKNTLTLANSGAIYGTPQSLAEMLESSTPKQREKAVSYQSALRTQNIPENIRVNPENVLLAPFRLISAFIVGAGTWKATDFSQNNVLRNSMPLLAGKPVYRDHMIYPDYWLGTVQQLEWGEAYLQDSIIVPAGINGLLAIDTSSEYNANLARGIVAGAVRSNSVTIEFEWQPSHEFDREWLFWDSIGTMVDGTMVRRIVTRILDYHETSIVGLGADPFAKLIDDMGELVDIDLAGSDGLPIKMLNATDEEKMQFCKNVESSTFLFIDFKKENTVLNLSKSNETMDKEKKQKGSFGTGFGQMLSGYIDGLAAQTSKKRGEVIASLAEAAGVSTRTVELYISGSQSCPKASYIDAWAKILLVDVNEFVQSLEADGCTFSDVELAAMLAGNAIDASAGDDKKEDEDEDESGMSKATTQQNATIVDESLEQLQAELKALQEKMQKLAGVKTEPTTNTQDDEAVQLEKAKKEAEEAKLAADKKEAELLEQRVAAAKTELEQLEKDGKTKAEELVANYQTAVKELEGVVAHYKAECENIKAEMEAQKIAFKELKTKDLESLSKLRAELEAEKSKVLVLNGEKKALELNKETLEDIMTELNLAKSKIEEYEMEIEKTKSEEHFSEIGRHHFAKMKAEAIRLYRAASGQNASEAVVQLFEQTTNIEQIEGLVKQYGKELAEEFHFRCQKCGSNEFDFASVTHTVNVGDITELAPISDEEIASSFSKK